MTKADVITLLIGSVLGLRIVETSGHWQNLRPNYDDIDP
jgi:hypothetical protein